MVLCKSKTWGSLIRGLDSRKQTIGYLSLQGVCWLVWALTSILWLNAVVLVDWRWAVRHSAIFTSYFLHQALSRFQLWPAKVTDWSESKVHLARKIEKKNILLQMFSGNISQLYSVNELIQKLKRHILFFPLDLNKCCVLMSLMAPILD